MKATAGDREVSLSWDLPTNASEIDNMQVRYRAPGNTWEAWVDLAADATTYTVTNLKNRQRHIFAVRAVNEAGEGEAASVAATPMLSAPDVPTNLSATAGNSKVSLSWDLPTNASEIDNVAGALEGYRPSAV